jgi:hypothetical protein
VMPEHEKEKIRTERRNHAKRKISKVTIVEEGHVQDDHNARSQGAGANITRQRADPINAGDQMSRRNRSISHIRSGI